MENRGYAIAKLQACVDRMRANQKAPNPRNPTAQEIEIAAHWAAIFTALD